MPRNGLTNASTSLQPKQQTFVADHATVGSLSEVFQTQFCRCDDSVSRPLAFCIRGSFASSPFSGVNNGVMGVVAPGRSKEGSQKTASPKYFLTNDQ